MGSAAIVNTVRGIAGGGNTMIDPRSLIPWADKPETLDPSTLDPASPDFDPEARTAADLAVFARASGGRLV